MPKKWLNSSSQHSKNLQFFFQSRFLYLFYLFISYPDLFLLEGEYRVGKLTLLLLRRLMHVCDSLGISGGFWGSFNKLFDIKGLKYVPGRIASTKKLGKDILLIWENSLWKDIAEFLWDFLFKILTLYSYDEFGDPLRTPFYPENWLLIEDLFKATPFNFEASNVEDKELYNLVLEELSEFSNSSRKRTLEQFWRWLYENKFM